MPAGIQVWNTDSFLQIDGTYRNLMLLGKWTAASYASPLGGNAFQTLGAVSLQEVSATFSTTVPILGIRCDYPVAVIDAIYNGSSVTVTYLIYTTSPVSVTFYAFGPQAASGVNYGMQIFNTTGTMVFDAVNKPLRVTGQIIGPGASSTYTFPVGRIYAMGITEFISLMSAPNTFPMDPLMFYTRFVRNSGASIISEEIQHTGNPPWSVVANNTYNNHHGRVLVIDVTNF